jgi:hypothetical protein
MHRLARPNRPHKARGFAAVAPARRREIAAMGGHAAQRNHRGFRWTREQAARWAPVGGRARQAARRSQHHSTPASIQASQLSPSVPAPCSAARVAGMLGLPLVPAAFRALQNFLRTYAGETWCEHQLLNDARWWVPIARRAERADLANLRRAFPNAPVADDVISVSIFGARIMLLACGGLRILYVVHPEGGSRNDVAVLPFVDVVNTTTKAPEWLVRFDIPAAIAALENLLRRHDGGPDMGRSPWVN